MFKCTTWRYSESGNIVFFVCAWIKGNVFGLTCIKTLVLVIEEAYL